jgi:hypothetical protein
VVLSEVNLSFLNVAFLGCLHGSHESSGFFLMFLQLGMSVCLDLGHSDIVDSDLVLEALFSIIRNSLVFSNQIGSLSNPLVLLLLVLSIETSLLGTVSFEMLSVLLVKHLNSLRGSIFQLFNLKSVSSGELSNCLGVGLDESVLLLSPLFFSLVSGSDKSGDFSSVASQGSSHLHFPLLVVLIPLRFPSRLLIGVRAVKAGLLSGMLGLKVVVPVLIKATSCLVSGFSLSSHLFPKSLGFLVGDVQFFFFGVVIVL